MERYLIFFILIYFKGLMHFYQLIEKVKKKNLSLIQTPYWL